MRKILLTPIIVFLTATTYSQVQEVWARSHGSGALTDQVIDASGNVYVTGHDGSEARTAKFDKDGNLKWATNTPNIYDPSAMTVDASGNVYIVGNTSIGGGHYVTAKYNATGFLEWTAIYFEDDVVGFATDIEVDASGYVYVTGISYTAFVGVPAHVDASSADYATIKYAPDGDQVWVRRYNGASPGDGFDAANSIAIDAFGYIYVTGTSQLNGQNDIATIKYNTTGDIVWLQRYDNGNSNLPDDAGYDVHLDAAGNVIVTGTSSDRNIVAIKYTFSGFQVWARNPTFGELVGGSFHGFRSITDNNNNVIILGGIGVANIAKFSSAGVQLWSKIFGSDDPMGEIGEQADIATDGSNIYLTGIGVLNATITGLNTIKFNGDGQELWRMKYEVPVSTIAGVRRIDVDPGQNVFVSHFAGYYTIRYSQCEIIIPSSIRINTDPGLCGAQVNVAATSTGDCGEIIYRDIFATRTYSLDSFYSEGHYHLEAYSPSTGATKRFTIYVEDHELPVITYCPPDKTLNTDPGVCYVTAANANIGTATATDNCDVTVRGVRSDGLVLTANYPTGITTITWTARDASFNTTTCSQTITIVDNVPPTITGESASVVVLSPSNHIMRDVTINYTATDGNNCGVTSVIAVTSNEPVNGVGDGDTDPDWIVTDNHHVVLRAERSANGSGRIYTITITATDGSGNTSAKTVEVRVPHNIKNPHSGQPFKVGSTVTFEGEFWDKAGNSHTAKWLIDENTTVKATVIESAGNKNGKVTGSYKFTAPGVYKLQMNVTDQKGVTNYSNTAGDLEAIVVIYDPSGGFAYGGGYYNSPVGALKSNPSATGKASYGFTVNYFKNSTYPKGETQFDFKVGSFEFNALNFEYLVINNSMSQFKGTGKITGGQSGVGFTMTVVDGQLDGSGVDKIRMKIYNRSNGVVIYDNQPGTSDAALPTQAVEANSTIVISGTNSGLTQSNTTQKAEMEATASEMSSGLYVIAYPNPSASNFSISVKADPAKEKITMQVVDMYGRIIETRNVNTNSPIRFGDRYNAGTYFVRVIQGKQHKEIKLIKLSD